MTSRITFAAAILLTATAAAAQERQPAKVPAPQHDKTTTEALAQLAPARVPLESRIVKDAPYTAEVITEHLQLLPDGNRIVQKTTGRVYRDSQGRMRREEEVEPGQPGHIMITDPVAGTSYALDPATRTAWKTPTEVAHAVVAKMKGGTADPGEVELKRKIEVEIAQAREAEMKHASGGAVVASGIMAAMPHIPGETKTEKLGPRSFDGVVAEGLRTTRTIPAGAIGNEQPIVSVTEQWRSSELQVLVMTRTSDPRSGESTYRLQNIVRGEQSRSWFDVPSDYTIQESGIRRLKSVK